jgi:hypothetical protein
MIEDNLERSVDEEDEEFQPFDPESISIDTKPITMDTCLRRLEQGTIILNPDFQRNEVWTLEKKCRLIESLMLKIPIPMFYVSADEKGNYYVVDGLQRLSTIRSFVLGDQYLETREARFKGYGFRLEKLEFWGDQYNKLQFSDLPINLQNRILETGFTFTIINPGTPEEVKRNIFKRINTGGEPLTSQEIRNALYVGPATRLLSKLAREPAFLSATSNAIKTGRMQDQEIVLRFVAFMVRDFKHYPRSSDMDDFLSNTMRILNAYYQPDSLETKRLYKTEIDRSSVSLFMVERLPAFFRTAMERAYQLFGEHAFRKSTPDGRRAPINKALFETWSVILAKLRDEEFTMLMKSHNLFLEEYYNYFELDDFFKAVSRDSWKQASVEYRHINLGLLVKKYSHD